MQLLGTHHVALFTDNFEALEKFYTETLGLPVTKRWDDAKIIFINVGSTTIELLGRDNRSGRVANQYGFDHLALHVEDVDVAYAELKAAGVNFTVDPKNFKDIRLAFFTDPDGNLIELFEEPRKPGKD
ncbi:MAG: VOC family protein [Caldilineaceae bacterium]|nr:VOC family protein [Caldilineaceae bacterium]